MKNSLSLFLSILALSLTYSTDAIAQTAEEDLETVINYVQNSDQISSSGQIPYDQMESVKEAGFDLVINLATANEAGNALEGFLVAEQNMTYMNIPVSWQEPRLEDLELFFDVMEVAGDRRVYVHCSANMRASVFVYLYRTLIVGEPESVAKADLEEVWDPSGSEQWAALIVSAREHFSNSSH